MTTTEARNNLIGISSALIASVCFSINDTIIKFLSGDYALHQIILIRSVIGMIVILAVIVPLDGGWATLKTKRLKLHLFRGLCVVVTNMTFFLALAAMPLANAVAIFFVSPLVITIFSVVFLGESVGPRRWVAVGMGLTGVIVMMRPGGDSFQMAALFPLVAAVSYAGLHILTRKMKDTERAGSLTFYIQLTFIFVSGAMGLFFGEGQFGQTGDPSMDFLLRDWIWPASSDYLLLFTIGAISAFAGYFISQAYRMCEAGLAAPFEYSAVLLAIFWGVVVFGEWPDAISWIGMSLIVGGGLFMLWREAVISRRLKKSFADQYQQQSAY